METYGICLDEAMKGCYPAPFVASLAEQLPPSCRWRVSYDPDAWWDGDRQLAAALVNGVRGLIWGLSDPKRRGPMPRVIGPTWADSSRRRGVSMPADKLMRLLTRSRREA